jgi:hypothetical protein
MESGRLPERRDIEKFPMTRRTGQVSQMTPQGIFRNEELRLCSGLNCVLQL